MIQINDDYYEDLNESNFRDLLNNLKNKKDIKLDHKLEDNHLIQKEIINVKRKR